MANILLILLAHTFFLAWAPMILFRLFPSAGSGSDASADITIGLLLALAILLYGVTFYDPTYVTALKREPYCVSKVEKRAFNLS